MKSVAVVLLSMLLAAPAAAEDLYGHGGWPAMASDRRAEAIGDSLTVLIYESSTATNSATGGSHKTTGLNAQVSGGGSHIGNLSEQGQLGISRSYDGGGQTGRTGSLVAEISVVVDQVLPNGDLHVLGEQTINVNGEKTRIKLKGRVRPQDIAANNTVLSSLLADVAIDYDGKGFVTRGAKPGLVTRIFDLLGVG